MTHKITMRTSATFHPYAECADCDWDTPTSSLARDRAKRHARAEGHSVRVVVEKVSVWGPVS